MELNAIKTVINDIQYAMNVNNNRVITFFIIR